MNKKLWLYLIQTICGALAVYLGLFVFTGPDIKQVSGMLIGLGAAAFCLGIGNFIGAKIMAKTETPEALRRKNIEVNDERNVRLKEKVGAKINQVVIYALTLIVIALGFMGADVVIILMVSSVFLLELVLLVVLTNHYSKLM